MPPSWLKGSTSTAVQHAYVNARLRDVYDKQGERHVEEALAVLPRLVPALATANRDALLRAYVQLQQRMQTADLTINLKCASWFSAENPYPSYATMYERAIGADGRMVLDDSDTKNPATTRSLADDMLTFPSGWVDVNASLTGVNASATKYDVTAPKGAPPARGLAPGARGARDIVGKMAPGPLQKVGNGTGADAKYVATNRQFDPRTKQVFAALNYGRRPHGSNTLYGHSYLVLADRLKTNAMYYAGDTFNVFAPGNRVSGNDQVGYHLLGSLIAKGSPRMRRDIVDSCYTGQGPLPDTDLPALLLEAHLFERLEFRDGVKALFVSALDRVSAGVGEDGNKLSRRMTGAEWMTVQTNARKFASKHGIRVYFIE